MDHRPWATMVRTRTVSRTAHARRRTLRSVLELGHAGYRPSDALPTLWRSDGPHGSWSRRTLEARSVLGLPGMRPPLLDHVSPAEDGVYHPPAQRDQAKLPTRRHLRHHVTECPGPLSWSDAIPDERQSVGQWVPPSETPAQR